LEDALHAVEHLQAEACELGAAMIDGRQAHRPQDPVGHRARTRDLQEVAAAGMLVERDHGKRRRDRQSCIQASLVKARFFYDALSARRSRLACKPWLASSRSLRACST